MLDVMPTDEDVLGFGNRWYSVAVRTAQSVQLPSGRSIRLIAPPVFLATKLEAFHGRGGGDFLASHDLEDIAVVIDGRPELVNEVATCEIAPRIYLATRSDPYSGAPLFSRRYRAICLVTKPAKHGCRSFMKGSGSSPDPTSWEQP